MICILMGVCGSGKTVVGEALAKELNIVFRDADEFHSVENKTKMAQSIPLTDEDRLPWLQAINKFILKMMETGNSGVLTCSALKKQYRQILLDGCSDSCKNDCSKVMIIYLKGSQECIQQRLEKRTGHFMPPALLKSQFSTLEEPKADESFCVNVEIDEKSVSEIVKNILGVL
ncbi:probable gluconokinase [Mytilus trossulus]|uniref:probable gluconokinase n=1 Tax=Mytilus trossulus TaxID=6551 RepID=UPI0030065340